MAAILIRFYLKFSPFPSLLPNRGYNRQIISKGHSLMDTLEILWEDLLSRRPARIRRAYARLTSERQQSVRAHLQRMVSEDGWHGEQVRSAQAALQALAQEEE
jgi:hypothetical protein